MEKIDRNFIVIIVAVFITALVGINYYSKTIEPETRYLSEEYGLEIEQLDTAIEQKLAELGFVADDFKAELAQEWIKESAGVQLSYPYNYYQLEISPFGSQARFLSDKKEAIIDSFKELELLEQKWEISDKKASLILDLGLQIEQDIFRLYTLEFRQKKPAAKLAIVIDDFGLGWSGLEEILTIPRAFTAAILPHEPGSLKQGQRIRELGHEIMLHQPMEPEHDYLDPGLGAIKTDMSADEIKEILVENIDSLPEIKGMNNHMGSKATADKEIMRILMEVLAKREIYFVDSNVSSNSVAHQMATEFGVKTAKNYYFIDNQDEQAKIEENLLNLSQVALDKGELIVIGHVKKNTALAIKEVIPKLEEQGISLVYVSRLLK